MLLCSFRSPLQPVDSANRHRYVEGCRDRRFPERYASFRATSPPRKPVNAISRHAGDPMPLMRRSASVRAGEPATTVCAGCRNQVSLTAGTGIGKPGCVADGFGLPVTELRTANRDSISASNGGRRTLATLRLGALSRGEDRGRWD
jgi:hypothetical protein